MQQAMNEEYEDMGFVVSEPVPMEAVRRVRDRTAALKLGQIHALISDNGPEPIDELEMLMTSMYAQRSQYAEQTQNLLDGSAHSASFWAYWFDSERGPYERPDADPIDDPNAWSRYLAGSMAESVGKTTDTSLLLQEWAMHAYSVLSFVQQERIGSVSTRFVSAMVNDELNDLVDSIDDYLSVLDRRFPMRSSTQLPTRF